MLFLNKNEAEQNETRSLVQFILQVENGEF
jgi:hypothetical protein